MKSCTSREILRISGQQSTRVFRHQGESLVVERAPADMCDESVVAQHVAEARRCRPHAEIVFLAVALAVGIRIESPDPSQSAAGGRTCKNPRPSEYRGRSAGAMPGRWQSRPMGGNSASGLFRQKTGNEHISALFENGVTVPMRGSLSAHRRILSSQPAVTIVSELSSSTSRSGCSTMPRLAVATKPRFSGLRNSSRHGARSGRHFAEIGGDSRLG